MASFSCMLKAPKHDTSVCALVPCARAAPLPKENILNVNLNLPTQIVAIAPYHRNSIEVFLVLKKHSGAVWAEMSASDALIKVQD